MNPKITVKLPFLQYHFGGSHKPFRQNEDFKTHSFSEYKKMRTIHRIFLPDPWFGFVKRGEKTVECLINRKNSFVYHPTKKIKSGPIKEGHLILWFNDHDSPIMTKITRIRKYKTIHDVLKREKLKTIFPLNGVATAQDGIDIFRKYYDEADELKFGILALEIRLHEPGPFDFLRGLIYDDQNPGNPSKEIHEKETIQTLDPR